MNSIQRPRGLQPSFWASILLVVGFGLFQSHTAVAQQNPVTTPGGTIGKIPKWTAGTALGDSVITESSTGNIGIGTAAPGAKLQIDTASGYGTGGNAIADGLILRHTNTVNGLQIMHGSATAFFAVNPDALGSGALGIGTTGGAAFPIYFYTGAGISNGTASTSGVRMTIAGSGNVGIGTMNPTAMLTVSGNGGQIDIERNSGYFLSSYPHLRFLYAGTEFFKSYMDAGWSTTYDTANSPGAGHIVLLPKGNVGIGTAGPTRKLSLDDTNVYASFNRSGSEKWVIGNEGTASDRFILYNTLGAGYVLTASASGNVGIGTTAPAAKLHVAGGDVSVTGTGSVSLTATGNITASGTIQGGNVIAKYQDVAEWVPASRAIPAATVVVLDAERSNHVLPSTRSYDTRVAGVVSEKPGVILGEAGEGKVMVATTGRVRVRVDASKGPIRVGDLLVTSDKEGIAMRSQPLDLGGTPIHRPGTLIGKALEPLEKGVGEILVLLSLQ